MKIDIKGKKFIDYLLVVVWFGVGMLNALTGNTTAAMFAIVIICILWSVDAQENLIKVQRGLIDIQREYIKGLEENNALLEKQCALPKEA